MFEWGIKRLLLEYCDHWPVNFGLLRDELRWV